MNVTRLTTANLCRDLVGNITVLSHDKGCNGDPDGYRYRIGLPDNRLEIRLEHKQVSESGQQISREKKFNTNTNNQCLTEKVPVFFKTFSQS